MKQYENSPIIQQLVDFYRQIFGVDIEEDFYNKIWNIDTASTYGLDIWGRIVGIGRYLTIPGQVDAFGFNTGVDDWTPFNNAPFYPEEVSTETYRLDDDAYRRLILAKAMSNVFGRSCQEINYMLTQLFMDKGVAYVLDMGKMKMRYVFEFFLEPYEQAIVSESGVFGRPAGVDVEILQLPDNTYFGFFGSDFETFNQGVFFGD